MPVKTVNAVEGANSILNTEQAPQTFMQGETRDTGPDYHFMVLTIGPSATADGTISGDMADARVMTWLGSGYRLAATHFLGKHELPGQGFAGFQFAYHFVKE